jgi:hypothetical protein
LTNCKAKRYTTDMNIPFLSQGFTAAVAAGLVACSSSGSGNNNGGNGTPDAGGQPAGIDASNNGGPDGSSQQQDGGGTPTNLPPPNVVGPYTVAESTAMIPDATLKIFTPSVGRKAPLVILKHGFQLSTNNYKKLAARVASHGFVVIGVDTNVGQDKERDLSISVIDYAVSTLSATVDENNIAMMGHSRGGKVSIMTAAKDSRIDAVLLLDPVNACGMDPGFSEACPDVTTAEIAGAITKPIGIMGETVSGGDGLFACAPTAKNYQTIFAAVNPAASKTEWTFTGADHMDFTDDGGGAAGLVCFAKGSGDDNEIRANVATLSVAFMRRHLTAENPMDAWLTGAMMPSDITQR